MLLGKVRNVLLVLGMAGTVFCSYAQVSLAGEFCLDCWRCPPPYVHCQEGPPRLKFKCACPRPVCSPCELRHYGYYPTCWSPYPWPLDYSCCPPPVVPAVVASSLMKLPEADFSQPAFKNPGQTTSLLPAGAGYVAPSSMSHPSPYHGQGLSPASDLSPGR